MTGMQRWEMLARKIVNRFVQKCKNPSLSPKSLRERIQRGTAKFKTWECR